MKMYLLSLASFLVVIAIIVFSGVSLPINSILINPAVRTLGGIIVLAGGIVRLFAWHQTKTWEIQDKIEGKHPEKGIYALARHPKLWGSFVMYLGMAIGLCSVVGIVLTFAVILPITFYRIKIYEEYISSNSTKSATNNTL